MPTAAIVTFIAGASLTFYLGILELLKKDKNWIKISVLTILFLIFLGAGIYDILYKDARDTENTNKVIDHTTETGKIIIDTFSSSQKELSNKFDSEFNKNKYPVLIPPKLNKEKASVELCVLTTPNPMLFKDTIENSYTLKFCVCNNGKGIAYDIKDKSAIVQIKNDKISIVGTMSQSAFNKHVVMYPIPNACWGIIQHILKIPGDFTNKQFFYCIKIYYSDSIGKHNTLIGIFNTTNFPINAQLETPNSEDFYKIERLLDDKNAW